ncbi:uncharacterized protein Nmnat [Lepeophtheirus salmonis]|uniref:uncharacterized protein Nmnat n=1 Tax=Lepeophtheirus salmonis TaxID=72036 RepID=UPI001AE2C150|nr:uncharacterized protein LOC121128842 [Lepeophtheirus salmonis]
MSRINVILLSAGSFNPPTHMHLRMFEIAKDFLHQNEKFHVLGGIMSPVHNDYKKESLSEANSTHRNAMVNLCIKKNPFLKLSTYETSQDSWTRLKIVLEEHKRLLLSSSQKQAPSWMPERFCLKEPFQILFLCGADLLESFSVPGLWLDDDVEVIVKDFGLVVISREGSNPEKFIYNSDILTKYKNNIHLVTEWITNDISSTKVRRAMRRNESVKYLIPDEVIEYISEHGLYGAGKNEYCNFIESISEVCSPSCLPEIPHPFNSSSNIPQKITSESIISECLKNMTKIDSFDSDDDIKDNSTSSCTSSVQSRLSLIKSITSPVVEEINGEIVSTPSDDEMSPLERDFTSREARLSPMQGNSLPLIDEIDETSIEEEVYDLEALKEALILDEKNAQVEETEGFIEETVEENIEFHSVIEKQQEEVREIIIEEFLHPDGEVVENSVPLIEECPKASVSPDVTDSLSTEEFDRTIIEIGPEKSLTHKDSIDFADMPPPPPLPYSESPVLHNTDTTEKSLREDEDMNQYVVNINIVVNKDKPEEFKSLEKEVVIEEVKKEEVFPSPPPPSLPTPKLYGKKSSKKSEDKVQIEITKKRHHCD